MERRRFYRYVGVIADGKNVYVQGEDGVQIKIGKRDMAGLAMVLIGSTDKYMIVPRKWSVKTAKKFEAKP